MVKSKIQIVLCSMEICMEFILRDEHEVNTQHEIIDSIKVNNITQRHRM